MQSLLTLDPLKRMGKALANWCFLYEEEEETVDHLLLHCTRDRILWELFIAIVGLSWVPPTTFCRHLAGQDVPVGKKCKKVWLVAALCLFWTVWLERNMVVFDNEVFFAHKMK